MVLFNLNTTIVMLLGATKSIQVSTREAHLLKVPDFLEADSPIEVCKVTKGVNGHSFCQVLYGQLICMYMIFQSTPKQKQTGLLEKKRNLQLSNCC